MELRIKNQQLLVGQYNKMEVATIEELQEIIRVATEQLNKANVNSIN
jgi:hypothetical protein